MDLILWYRIHCSNDDAATTGTPNSSQIADNTELSAAEEEKSDRELQSLGMRMIQLMSQMREENEG
jgi:hypothetical protein